MTYDGRCHCGAVRFRFQSEPITGAVRCNCSICIRRGAAMSDRYYSAGELEILQRDSLVNYQFGDKEMNHWFCGVCGVHPFSEAIVKRQYRVNLGCVEGVDPLALPVRLIDGRSF